jgi:hypothetical protein
MFKQLIVLELNINPNMLKGLFICKWRRYYIQSVRFLITHLFKFRHTKSWNLSYHICRKTVLNIESYCFRNLHLILAKQGIYNKTVISGICLYDKQMVVGILLGLLVHCLVIICS